MLEYLGTLTVTQGRLAGQPLPIFPWERRFVNGAFKPDVVDAALSVGRGNGKTTLIAAVATAAIDGPLAVPRAETVVVASSFEQSKITYNHVLAFLPEKYGAMLEDRSQWRIQDSANRAHITNRANGATLKCIGSDPRRAHGLAPVLVLADEGAQWEPGTAEAMLAALRTSLGKVPGGKLIALGTRPMEFTVRIGTGLRFQLREEPGDPVGVLRLPRPRLDAVPHVASAALFVGREGGAPDALRGGELGAVLWVT